MMIVYECGNEACRAAYKLPLVGCPRCGSQLFEKEGGLMPKATLGGASNAADESADVDARAEAVAEDTATAHAEAEAAAQPDASEPGAADTGQARPASAAPKAADPKSEWVAWAIGRGLPEAEAEGMIKAALMQWEPPAPGDEGAEPAEAMELRITAEAEVTRGDTGQDPGE
jgi:hypothetical protein